MNAPRQRLVGSILAVASGALAAGIAVWLTFDATSSRSHAAHVQVEVDALIEAVQLDAAVADELHGKREAVADAAIEREPRKELVAFVLLGSAAAFVLSCKWMIALRPRRVTYPPKLIQLTVSGSMPETEPDAEREPSRVRDGAVERRRGAHPSRDREGADSKGAVLPVLGPLPYGRGSVGEPIPAGCGSDCVNLSFVDDCIEREGRGPEAAIPILQDIQQHYRYLPEAALRRVCATTEITPAQIAGIATFYNQFRTTPVGKYVIRVCHGTACHVAGAELNTDELRRHLNIAPGDDTDPAREFTVEPVACLGCCTLAPVVRIDDEIHGHVDANEALRLAEELRNPKANRDADKRTHHDRLRMFDLDHVPGEIRIGLGSCCVANGSARVHDTLVDTLAAIDAEARVKRVGCVGTCYQTPLVEIDLPGKPTVLYTHVQPEHVPEIVRRHFKPPGLLRRTRRVVSDVFSGLRHSPAREAVDNRSVEPRDPRVAEFLGPQKHIATQHYGAIDPTDLDDYLRHDGFEGLKRCLRELSPAGVIDEIKASGLRGRGGAGFPTHVKWTKVHDAPGGLKYIICNGDEGDPGAFMDRVIMESYPYRIIEGMAIAARATGATEGYFYIRREYPLAVARIREALRKCEERGVVGDDALGPGRPLRLRVVEGAGAFVCGEETALIASLEGERGMPRLRPPYPAESGLWGRPTLVNNVETLAVIPWIMRHGADEFASLGTESSKGTKVFALAGKVKRGGLIEVPMGVTIRQIVEEIGGGIRDEETPAGLRCHRFKAVQIGGPSGGCVPAELADTPIDYEALRSVGAIMGSGGLVVLDETDCMVDMARYFLSFTQDQSCGKCTPCRVGTRRLLEILERICRGEGRRRDLDELEELSGMVGASSLCGLGQTAPNPILTTLRYFRDEFEAHIEGRCPAGRCKELISYEVVDGCTGCTICAQNCPVDAIEMTPYIKHEIDVDKCTRCDACRAACPEGTIEIVPRRRLDALVDAGTGTSRYSSAILAARE